MDYLKTNIGIRTLEIVTAQLSPLRRFIPDILYSLRVAYFRIINKRVYPNLTEISVRFLHVPNRNVLACRAEIQVRCLTKVQMINRITNALFYSQCWHCANTMLVAVVG